MPQHRRKIDKFSILKQEKVVLIILCWQFILTAVWLERLKDFLLLTSLITAEIGFEALFNEKREENADALPFKGTYNKKVQPQLFRLVIVITIKDKCDKKRHF